MKYKIGDKVKYDGGDWWFYGTVSAVFEHSISPCYRLNVERMEKKSCKFSITQFEFELEPYHVVVESGKDKRKWDNTDIELLKKHYGVLDIEDLSKILKRSPQTIEEKWQQIKPEALLTDTSDNAIIKVQIPANEAEPEPVKKRGRRRKQEQEPEPEKKQRRRRKQELKQETESENIETIQKPKRERRKRGEAWDTNLEMYRNGEKSNIISSWIAQNRKEYKEGKLSEKKLDRLLEISFPFEPTRKKKMIVGTND